MLRKISGSLQVRSFFLMNNWISLGFFELLKLLRFPTAAAIGKYCFATCAN